MRGLLTIVFVTILISTHCLASGELTVLTENLPPLNYIKEGRLVGPVVEVVREIQHRVGSQAPIQVYPWARAYQKALDEENVVLFSMTYSKIRHDKFKWIGPVAKKRDILVAHKDSGIQINGLDDARNVRRIGTLRGDTRERLLMSLGFKNLEPVSDERKNAQKLALGRIDLWAYKKPGMKTVCELAGVDESTFEEVFHLREIELMIAFSKKTSDTIVEKWKVAFADMAADGTVLEIQKKWNDILDDVPFPELQQ